MRDLERFIDDCRRAVASGGGQKAVQELVEAAVSDPAATLAVLGEPERAGVQKLFVSEELTVLNVIWGPRMTLMPHNHDMWALIGIYTGREDNIFWRRIPGETSGKIKAAGAKALEVKDVAVLGRDIIHSVTNPVNRLTGALHVYGGQFFTHPRKEWDPETLHEGPYDIVKNMQLFEDSNRNLR
jgi:predicted metal-dependent enzyme (double-stranded beta helix superfamily)